MLAAYLTDETSEGNKIAIMEKKIPTRSAIKILGNGIVVDGETTRSGSISFSKKDIKHLNEKYSNDTLKTYWRASDFGARNFQMISDDEQVLKAKAQALRNGIKNFYAFSKPIQYKQKYFFQISKAAGFQLIFSGVIVLEKNNGRWIVIEKIETTELY